MSTNNARPGGKRSVREAPARASVAKLPRELVRELERAARGPQVEEALRWMERFLRARERGRLADARRAAVRAKQSAPRAPSIREALGVVGYELGEWHEASQELLAYRRLTGDRRHDPLIADCYRLLGKPARAVEFLADLTADAVSGRTWAGVLIARARSLAALGREDVAANMLTAELRSIRAPDERRRVVAAREELTS